MSKTALVLAGGGSRGAYQAGVCRALSEMGVTIDIVTGTSVGALNGAFVAQNDIDRMTELWNRIEVGMVLDVKIDESLPPDRKLKAEVLEYLARMPRDFAFRAEPLKELLGSYLDERRIRQSSVEFGIVTVRAGRPDGTPFSKEVFKEDIPDGRLCDYLMASAALFPAMKPYEIDGEAYIDGGYYDSMPVSMALAKGATEIIAVDLSALGARRKIDPAAKGVPIKTIRSHWDLGPTLVFDKAVSKRLIRLGYLDCLKAFGVFDGQAFTFIKDAFSLGSCRAAGKAAQIVRSMAPKGGMVLPLDKIAWQSLRKHVKRKYGGRLTLGRHALMIAAESAGEIFRTDAQKIYSEDIFKREVEKAVEKLSLPGDHEKVGFDRLRESLSLLEPSKRAVLLSDFIADSVKKQHQDAMLAAASLLPNEFFAGLFLYCETKSKE